jgi:hypothetical protein
VNSHEDTPNSQDLLAMFVLDVMRYDEVESVDGILQLINNTTNIGWRTAWPHDFTEEEIIKGLEVLLAKRMIRPLTYDEQSKEIIDWRGPGLPPLKLTDMWFRITELGWKEWEHWTPPKE